MPYANFRFTQSSTFMSTPAGGQACTSKTWQALGMSASRLRIHQYTPCKSREGPPMMCKKMGFSPEAPLVAAAAQSACGAALSAA